MYSLWNRNIKFRNMVESQLVLQWSSLAALFHVWVLALQFNCSLHLICITANLCVYTAVWDRNFPALTVTPACSITNTSTVLFLLLIQATNDLENYDKERHDEFKRYEMMKEHNRREHLKTLDDEERRKEEQHYEEMRKKHADHPKINHPVSGKGGHTDGGGGSGFSELTIDPPVFAGEPESAQRGLGGGRRPGPWRLWPQDLLQIAR